MSMSMKDKEPAFDGAGKNEGVEVWHIDNLQPVPIPKSSHGEFFAGDSYVILKTTALKNSSLRHDIHYWLGKDTSQDIASAASIKTVILNAVIGGRAVQYREPQGNETEKFLSYFRPCFIPQQSEPKNDLDSHETRLYFCKGRHFIHMKEIPFARSSLNHKGIFILDTRSKIFQFNGSSTSIQERAKALDAVQYIKDAYHGGKCEVAAVEDGKLMADADAGEFWALFGGFAPLPRKAASEEARREEPCSMKLFRVEKGQATSMDFDALTRELLDTNKCYLLDCGTEVYVWYGKSSSLLEMISTSSAAEERIIASDRPTCHIIRFLEGSETVMFRSKFQTWPKAGEKAAEPAGRSKVAALLKRQGLNVRGLKKVADTPKEEEPRPYIDCTGSLQVWRVNGQEKVLLSDSDQSRFYSGDCYIFEYAYSGEDKEEYLVGSWFGRKSVEEERSATLCLIRKMVESVKSQAVQTRQYEGKELPQFFSIFQIFISYKGGLSCGYKNFITENNLTDDTYSENGLALFRLQGVVPDFMRAIQVEPVASSLNSCYCYILHNDTNVFTWCGNLTTAEDQDLLERMLDQIQPNSQPRPVKEGAEPPRFWSLLGGKSDYPGERIRVEPESDPHLFCCDSSKGNLKVTEIFNFTQDDLMTEDIYILDCHSVIFVWIGEMVDSKIRMNALSIGEEFIKCDFLLETLHHETPIFIVTEGNEPLYFTRFFKWKSAKSAILGNSFERKLAMVKTGSTRAIERHRRRIPTHTGRVCVSEKSQRSRSMSLTPEKLRERGRSPAFNALAACFESPVVSRNLSTPPPAITTLLPKSTPPETPKMMSRSAAIAALTANFESAKEDIESKLSRGSFKIRAPKGNPNATFSQSPLSGRGKGDLLPTIQDADEAEEEKLPIYPYERLKTTSSDPVTEIDFTMREAYLSSTEFMEKFGMPKSVFNKLPKWRQCKLKMKVHLF